MTLHRILYCYILTLMPPRLTPFPYTTLFRSERKLPPLIEESIALERRPGDASEVLAVAARTVLLELRLTAARLRRDRKSTRLNSSHLVISYVVFCLKKKKNKVSLIILTTTQL